MDEPAAGPGPVPAVHGVARCAATHVKVVLGGQGGDEIFGGYARYLVAYLEQALKGAIHETTEEGEHIVSLQSILPNLPSLQQYQPMLQDFWREGLFEDDGPALLPPHRPQRRHAVDCCRPNSARGFDTDERFERFRAVFNHPDTKSYYNKMTHYDMVTSLPALLQVEDRVTMASSLESRVPLLDHRIVDLVATHAAAHEVPGRRAEVPAQARDAATCCRQPVLDRKDKMGFPVPLHLWARGAARDFFGDVLLSRRCAERGLFDRAEVEKLMQSRACVRPSPVGPAEPRALVPQLHRCQPSPRTRAAERARSFRSTPHRIPNPCHFASARTSTSPRGKCARSPSSAPASSACRWRRCSRTRASARAATRRPP